MTEDKGRYSLVYARTWTDQAFRALSAPQPNAQTLFLYLLSGPVTQPVPGLIWAGPGTLSEHLGWDIEDTRRCFAELLGGDGQKQLIKFDPCTGLIRLPKCFHYCTPRNPNQLKTWKKSFDLLPHCALKYEWLSDLELIGQSLGEWFALSFKQLFNQQSCEQLTLLLPGLLAEPEKEKRKRKERTTTTEVDQSRTSEDQDVVVVGFVEILRKLGLDEATIQETLQTYSLDHIALAKDHALAKAHENPGGYFLTLVKNPNLGPLPEKKGDPMETEQERAERLRKAEVQKQEDLLAVEEEKAVSAAWEALSEVKQQIYQELAATKLDQTLRQNQFVVLTTAKSLFAKELNIEDQFHKCPCCGFVAVDRLEVCPKCRTKAVNGQSAKGE